ncbi:non-hydrolyzing UDP-N-acetylglucosamine 2-epimerase [Chitinophagaceae bacterium MMS25-I14]
MFLDLIAGARPNFIKIAPIIEAIRNEQKNGTNIRYRLIHTGQHYDKHMSSEFFEQLCIPAPDVNLHAKGETQAELTAAIMNRYEQVLQAERPDLAMVVGDVTSTMACAITAKKMNNIPLAHVEAGIRSGDLTMPEEINRIVTDAITDFFFTTTHTANYNLRHSGVPEEKIFFVGNTMIDTLLKQMPSFKQPDFWDTLELEPGKYIVMTLHRPSNVDNEQKLKSLIDAIVKASKNLPIIFPVHPRTAKALKKINVSYKNLHITDPLGYLEFNYLVRRAKAVITDSGGITEETTVMHVPCMTLRDTTERPETCSIGTSMLLGTAPEAIAPAFEKLFSGNWQKGGVPELWDGHTAQRIIDQLKTFF